MIVYSVTVKIDHSVHDDWVKWMQEVHIPDVMKTGYFESNSMFRILLNDDEEGVNYSIQYTCESMAKLQQYQGNEAPKLQQEHTERYKDKFIAFRTLLEKV